MLPITILSRGVLTIVLISAMVRSGWAGDLVQSSGGEVPKTAERPMARRIRAAEVWAGAALMAGGVFVALYGFGNPSEPVVHFDPTVDSFPHRTGVGFLGVGLTAAGGVLLWHGIMRPALDVGSHAFVRRSRPSSSSSGIRSRHPAPYSTSSQSASPDVSPLDSVR
jgi:hypothetical protein